MSSSLQLTDRPLNKKLYAELKAIGGAMGLDINVKKDLLVRSIQRHIQANPNIADDPNFLPLFAHRSTPKASAKTSAGKAVEDEGEALKPEQAATGANKTLIAHRHSVQPPAQFKRLALSERKPSKLGGDGSDSGDETSTADEAPPRGDASSPKPQAVVQVNFLDEHNPGVTLRQVVVDDFPVVISTSGDGTKKYSASLSDLLPAAIKNDSPIKERGGRMYRPNIRNDPGHHHIGKIDALLGGTSSALQPRAMNEYALRPSEEGTFFCDLYWDAPAPVNTVAPPGPVDRLVFTGAGSDVPLDIAVDRARHNPFHKDAAPGLLESFTKWLHAQIQAAVPDIPDFNEPWPTCTFAGQMLDRYLLQEAIFKFLSTKKWARAKGFKIPDASESYGGVTFKNDFLLNTFKLGGTTTSDLTKWFSPEFLQYAPKVQAWVESNGVTNDSRFRKLKSARFKDYLSDRRDNKGATSSRKKARRRRSSSSSPDPRPSRKHKSSGLSEDEEGNYHRSSNKKGKARMTSVNLDGSGE
ncbi:hypothetical protein B0H16DRAFT_1778644 [Mycena metata]|uniref:Uncharacterized protein n=1 Tax=Mycena metata TaxID=1033252 RepID=A0AAD7HST6_9AGAR|nr:hypothetical protein B0H16DRAFT_1778644 [Mycena metata]